MRRLYLIGSTGYPNFGDEAIARVWLRWLALHHPDDEVWLDCGWPGSATVLLADAHPRLRCVDTLFSVLARTIDVEESVDLARRAVAPHHAAGAMRLHGLRILAGADVVHAIGGGYANGLWPHHVGVLAAVAEVGRRYGARTALTGQGLIPLAPASETVLRHLINRIDVVDVRDEPSALAVGVAYTGDDLFLDPWSALDPSPLEPPDVVVVAQGDLHDRHDSLAEVVLRRLQEWAVDPAKVAFLECVPGLDRVCYDLLAARLPQCRFIPFAEVWDRGLPALPGQRWISSRFHPHLLAAAAGAAGIAVSVQPDYYKVKHDSLSLAGSGWSRATLDQPLPDSGPAGNISTSGLRAAKQALASHIYGSGQAGRWFGTNRLGRLAARAAR